MLKTLLWMLLFVGSGSAISHPKIKRHLRTHPRLEKCAWTVAAIAAMYLFAGLFVDVDKSVKWAYDRITLGKYLDRDYAVAECDKQLTATCVKYGGAFGQSETLAKIHACPKLTLLPSSHPQLQWTSLWITNIYSYAPGGGGPGGGLIDADLKVGGWGDWYFSLIKFELPTKNSNAVFAGVVLFVQNDEQETVPLYVDRIIEPWKWDLTKQIWWKDRPGGFPVISEPYPAPRKLHWYVVEITRLYNQWGSGAIGNFGFQIRPSTNYGSIIRFTNNLSLDNSKIPHLLICER
jgi:hypothetical protein